MATAQTRIDRALRLIGVIASGESPTATEGSDALIALNAMIDSWRNDRLLVYALTDQALTLTSAASYTIGPTGGLVITRPLKVASAYLRDSNEDYPVDVITKAEWDRIGNKTDTGTYPTKIYYAPTVPDGTLYAYPLTTGTLYLTLWTPISTIATVGTTVTLPPGYDVAIDSNLALVLAPEYEREPSAALIKMAKESLAAIKRTNSLPIRGYCELGAGRRENILTGE